MFTILCLLCLCGNREYPSSFQSKAASIKIFLSAQVKWKGRYFWSGCKHSRFIIYLLHMGVILTIIKAFTILFLLCQWEQGTPWQFSKQTSKLSFHLSFRIYSLLAQTEEERKTYLGRVQNEGPHCEIIPKGTSLS